MAQRRRKGFDSVDPERRESAGRDGHSTSSKGPNEQELDDDEHNYQQTSSRLENDDEDVDEFKDDGDYERTSSNYNDDQKYDADDLTYERRGRPDHSQRSHDDQSSRGFESTDRAKVSRIVSKGGRTPHSERGDDSRGGAERQRSSGRGRNKSNSNNNVNRSSQRRNSASEKGKAGGNDGRDRFPGNSNGKSGSSERSPGNSSGRSHGNNGRLISGRSGSRGR